MPELPEVETVARQLRPDLAGRRIASVELLDAKLDHLPVAELAGQVIRGVERVGKWVVLALARPRRAERYLAVHLRMTGRLIYRAEPDAAHDQRHLRARFVLDRGALLFYDARRFGLVELHEDRSTLRTGGVDPLQDRFTPEVLGGLLQGSRQELKTWLLRQDRLVGLGNIYASEALYRARLDPARSAGSLDAGETRRLHRAVSEVLTAAVKHCGTTFSDFQDSRGEVGGYQRYLAVYAREGEPCRRCRTAIVRVTQQQRSTFYCPGCQRQGDRRHFGSR
ncbi:MAG: bifunctional DNA-formamidopyrimidine glycosylase/DNA-(apurinic or apyrimidinic site) lyase [Deltaproteobacteria bacterium]|nr:bifunctional DNA-formamidopyrimidine glycosylase/DNA-(apurinic or apyrimidinic site) lyase [Deltaproteobacteria bacterium]